MNTTNPTLESLQLQPGKPAQYATRLATCAEDVRAAQKLRFEVFNLELNEGLAESLQTGFDADPFDAVCDHLVVQHVASGCVVGTYRLQSGMSAAKHLGYYCAQEFDLEAFGEVRSEMLELGRACVHQDHRNVAVLGLLWRGIADYAVRHGLRYFIGCSSLTSQDPAEGASAYEVLKAEHLAPPVWQTTPHAAFECPLVERAPQPPKIPKLLRGYLSLGAKICGPPALDAQFKTIDFLTMLDLHCVPHAARQRFLAR